jgi:Trk K+ transport system NAD-binding subunit
MKQAHRAPTRNAGLKLNDDLQDHVVLCGYGRVGSAVGVALETFRIPFAVIERDPDVAVAVRSRGIPCLFGDAAHPHLLAEAGTAKAALVIVTLPEPDAAQFALRSTRKLNPGVMIISRAHRVEDVQLLHAAGANEVVQPEAVASASMIQSALSALRLPEDRAAAYLERFQNALIGTGAEKSSLPYLEVRELKVNKTPLEGQDLRQARIRERFGVTVISIRRASGEALVNPPAEAPLVDGDTLRVFGLPQQIDMLAAELMAGNIPLQKTGI